MTAYWPTAIPCTPQIPFQIRPQDARVGFQPARGKPITRRATTGSVRAVPLRFEMTRAQFAAFETWFEETLAQGSEPFSMREPLTAKVYLWRFAVSDDAPWLADVKASGYIDVSMTLVRDPSQPWFAGYVRSGSNVAPSFVADWDAGVYGIGGSSVAASALPGIEGTYDTYEVNSADEETATDDDVITAGDVTEAQPLGIKRLVGFPSDPL